MKYDYFFFAITRGYMEENPESLKKIIFSNRYCREGPKIIFYKSLEFRARRRQANEGQA